MSDARTLRLSLGTALAFAAAGVVVLAALSAITAVRGWHGVNPEDEAPAVVLADGAPSTTPRTDAYDAPGDAAARRAQARSIVLAGAGADDTVRGPRTADSRSRPRAVARPVGSRGRTRIVAPRPTAPAGPAPVPQAPPSAPTPAPAAASPPTREAAPAPRPTKSASPAPVAPARQQSGPRPARGNSQAPGQLKKQNRRDAGAPDQPAATPVPPRSEIAPATPGARPGAGEQHPRRAAPPRGRGGRPRA